MKHKRFTKVFLTPAGRDVARLAEKGFTAEFIAKQTGLTVSQVNYRAAQAGIRLRDYRQGKGEAAARALRLPATPPLLSKIDRLCREIDSFITNARKAHRQ